MADQTKNGSRTGRIVEIKGVVLDAVFPSGLPEINHALSIQAPSPDGKGTVELIAEVQQHLGDDRVRAVAMDTTDGLARGTEVVDTGEPISVPVGDQTLGRIWNVIGDPVDGKDKATGERWPIHRDPPSFGELSPKTEIYRAFLESAASFLASQMTAMRNASKNAGELIDRYTLQMNRARQAQITQEILEIVAGADALAG